MLDLVTVAIHPMVTNAHDLISMIPMQYNAPSIDWRPSESMKQTSRKIAFVLAFVWLLFFLAKFAVPSRRGGMGGGGGVGAQLIGAAVGIILLLDLDLIPLLINWCLETMWGFAAMLGFVS